MTEASTSTCAEALLSSWISHFSVPDSITTDRGPAFLSEFWVSLAHLMGATHHSTMAYNPAANGMVGRTHHSLKAALMARCTDDNWKAQLPWVLLGLCTAPRANGEESPAEKVYGEKLAIPGEIDAHRPPLTRPYRGPYRVVNRASKAYLINIHGREDWVSVDRLKPAFLMDS
ncbi:uncharacterized protein [Macrobrachium rosenbergii]|uniref:uncharacterized protein n=1 Tax=Macrobrachium rosenbergii TaxID=79674 RepID=UPI0034D42B6E